MYPLEGNEKAIGLDYRKNEKQREAALRAVDSGKMVLAGPIDLIQGGQGFIGRFPVFIDDVAGKPYSWGIVSAVVDVGRLYADSGLLSNELPIEIAISGRDATGNDSSVFFGKPEIFNNDPVVLDVSLPSGGWRIAATPKGGWEETPENVWQIRMLIVAAGLLLILPISIAGYLYDQRRTHIRELNRRQRQM